MTTGTGAAGLDVGDVLDGRYMLLRDIGRGAAGAVYEARHLFTGRFVAVKILLSQVRRKDQEELRARLQREGRALASIRHPGIVEVLDGGVTAEGCSYLVMEMLEGRTLEGLIAARTTLSVSDTVGVALQICDALEAVHRSGVVHRDVKPSNVIILRDAAGLERVKLLDFGVAKVLEPSEDEKLTRTGAVIGTPAYMSPEQLLAEGDVDTQTDIYSLGVTMYECLSGTTPHQGSYAKALLSAAQGKAPPALGSIAPETPQRLAAIVDRAMEGARTSRFASVVDLSAAIEQAVPRASRRTTLLGPSPGSSPTSQKPTHVEQRRRGARAPYSTPVHLVVQGGVVDGRSEDISEAGLLILSMAICAMGQRVALRFALPMEGKVVSVEADVRWVRVAHGPDKQGLSAMGLEFFELSEPVRASIARYVSLMSDPGRA
jgi:serine/threonine-protein kinase